jgi:hypothetical protein
VDAASFRIPKLAKQELLPLVVVKLAKALQEMHTINF